MANNKVILNGETLIDLTEDTVTEDTLLEGETAHDASGNAIIGRARQGAFSWEELEGKPFNEVGADFKIEDDVLAIADSVKNQINKNTETLSESADWLKSPNIADIRNVMLKTNWNFGPIDSRCFLMIPIKPNTTYAISINNFTGNWFGYSPRRSATDGDRPHGSTLVTAGTSGSAIYTSESDVAYLGLQIEWASGHVCSMADFTNMEIQVTESETVLPYQPYSDSNVELTAKLSQNENEGFLKKNLFNTNSFSSTIGSGARYTPISDSSFTIIGADVYSATCFKTNFKANKTYIIEFDYDNSRNITLLFTNEHENITSETITVTKGNKCEITIPNDNTNYQKLYVYSGTRGSNYGTTTFSNFTIRDAKSNSEITEELTWKYDNTYTASPITTPKGAKEILLIGAYGNMYLHLQIKGVGFRSGFYNSASDCGDIYAKFDDSNITINAYKIAGTSEIGKGIKVYYR